MLSILIHEEMERKQATAFAEQYERFARSNNRIPFVMDFSIVHGSLFSMVAPLSPASIQLQMTETMR